MRHKQINAVFAAILVFFAVFVALPLLALLRNAFAGAQGVSLEHFRAAAAEGALGRAFGNSVKVSVTSAAITTILAFILAYTESFTNIPRAAKKALRSLAVFPMLLPTITYGFAVIYSFGKTGLVTKIFHRQLFDFYGFKGLVYCYVIYTLPISFTLIRNTMGCIDKTYITVCRLMGDGPARRFWTAALRPMLGTLAASLVQSFFLSFTDFGVPASIGGRYVVVAELLYNTMLGSLPNFNQGAVIALAMLAPSALSVALLNYLDRFNVRYSKASKIDLPKNTARDAILGTLSALILVCALSVFVVVFVSPFAAEWPYDLSFSARALVSAARDKGLSRVFANSLVSSLFTALLGTALVYSAALVTARSRLHPRGALAIESIAQITNALPGMTLGIAFLLAFKKTPLKNTMAIIVFCNMIHFFATPFLMMKGSLDKMNDGYETTAALLGDNWIKTVARVITPNALPSLLESFCYLFINGMVTVSALVFIAGARTMVVTTKIQELQHFAKFNEIFILSILIMAVNLALKAVKGAANEKIFK